MNPRKEVAGAVGGMDTTGCPFMKPAIKTLKLRNWQSGSESVDRLQGKQRSQVAPCNDSVCLGSVMLPPTGSGLTTVPTKDGGSERSINQVIQMAKEFYNEYFASIKKFSSREHLQRLHDVVTELQETETYTMTKAELEFGAKLAWRNAVRCIGRIQWSKLHLFDARHVTTSKEMFETICEHIRYATNEGNIRSAISIFPQRKHSNGHGDFRVWNQQLVAYAGYKNNDGSILGDPANVEFTEVCTKLGWKGQRTKWDVLPIVLSASGKDPEVFELPEDIVLQVPIRHPLYEWFDDLDMKWFALPAVSGMLFDCGGLHYTACPFNGWYMGTEIGCRDLGDVQRYNMLPHVAKRMGLDTNNSTTLWKDKALVELNIAVLHSYQKAGVTIVDHHTAAETFIKHHETETRIRGGCPADWVWIVPPMSGSTTPVFQQEMAVYYLKPSYEYQLPAWKNHIWNSTNLLQVDNVGRNNIKTFKVLSKAVLFSTKLFYMTLTKRVNVTILYASETGKSEGFARRLAQIFDNAFKVKLCKMDEYNVNDFATETMVLVVASTAGNGDAPENGRTFSKWLYAMKKDKIRSLEGVNYFNTSFAVFALGSSAYGKFCGFGNNVNNLLSEIGCKRLLQICCGDELAGQEATFQNWAREIFLSACAQYRVTVDDHLQKITAAKKEFVVTSESVRLSPVQNATSHLEALSQLHNRELSVYHLVEKMNLHKADKIGSTTFKLVLRNSKNPLVYQCGDHIGLFPKNQREQVDYILSRLVNKPLENVPIQLQKIAEASIWEPKDKLPKCTLRELLSCYLDVASTPRTNVLDVLATFAMDTEDRKLLTKLANEPVTYSIWKELYSPTVATVFEQFSSLQPDAAVLCALLPTLQPRYYSVSSSPLSFPNEFHLTVGVVRYKTEEDQSTRYGVCSNYLYQMEVGCDLVCFIRKAPSFHLPIDDTKPVIMIGAGTGIAPFRGFWQERKARLAQKSIDDYGSMTLFFGCRTKSTTLYKSELDALKKEGIMGKPFMAYSREPKLQKMYVQDRLRQETKMIANHILHKGGHIYVCGESTMAVQVSQVVQEIIKETGNFSEAQVQEYMQQLKDDGRYHEDVFGNTRPKTDMNKNNTNPRKGTRSTEPKLMRFVLCGRI